MNNIKYSANENNIDGTKTLQISFMLLHYLLVVWNMANKNSENGIFNSHIELNSSISTFNTKVDVSLFQSNLFFVQK